MQVCTGCEYIQVGSVRETRGITGRLPDKLKLQLTVMGKCYLLPYSRPSQYRRSWDCEKLALFRNCGIGREFKLKNSIWDLKWAAVLGGRRYWEGWYWEGQCWEGQYWDGRCWEGRWYWDDFTCSLSTILLFFSMCHFSRGASESVWGGDRLVIRFQTL